MKQILVYLNHRYNFILEDLDERHCFVDTSNPALLRTILKECYELLDANTFVKDEESKE